jgi:hypothetical protein
MFRSIASFLKEMKFRVEFLFVKSLGAKLFFWDKDQS